MVTELPCGSRTLTMTHHLDLKLQVFVSHNASAGNQTRSSERPTSVHNRKVITSAVRHTTLCYAPSWLCIPWSCQRGLINNKEDWKYKSSILPTLSPNSTYHILLWYKRAQLRLENTVMQFLLKPQVTTCTLHLFFSSFHSCSLQHSF